MPSKPTMGSGRGKSGEPYVNPILSLVAWKFVWNFGTASSASERRKPWLRREPQNILRNLSWVWWWKRWYKLAYGLIRY